MNKLRQKYQVVIVGGGPVGLFLGRCLQHKGISCIILERREKTVSHSRSIGIHPVSLELFDQLDLAGPFVEEGIQIKKGLAFSDTKLLGSISFENGPMPYNFVLSLPQYKTERLLQASLSSSGILLRGAEVTGLNQTETSVSVSFNHNGQSYFVEADYLTGCDGKHSLVREKTNIGLIGTSYPDTYIMADFRDNTDFGADAAVFLTSEGLIESFPLIDNKRRWVVKTQEYISNVTRSDIEQRLLRRIDHDVSQEPHSMLSSFGVQKLIAETFFRGRVVLAGDAAHIISPIGGQGMNLGWIDAWELARTFEKIYSEPDFHREVLLKSYFQQQQKMTRKVVRRAELNTRLGRKPSIPFLRNAAVRAMLTPPVNKIMAQIFTMRKLR